MNCSGINNMLSHHYTITISGSTNFYEKNLNAYAFTTLQTCRNLQKPCIGRGISYYPRIR